MDVVENIYVGNEKTKGFGLVDYKSMEAEARSKMNELGIDLKLDTKIENLSVSDQQFVKILKALSVQPRVDVYKRQDQNRAAGLPGDLHLQGRRGAVIVPHCGKFCRAAGKMLSGGAFVCYTETRKTRPARPRRPLDTGGTDPVSYTHLDVYKRQVPGRGH